MSNSPATAPANATGIGASVKRREDFRFLTGQGTYTDDINRPNQTHAYILRSPYAHARINGIDTAAALEAPGVVAVFTGKDIAADKVNGLPCGWLIHSKDGSPMVEPPHPPLVLDKVVHVGDQVAVIIAETCEQAKDAAELIMVDYDELPAVTTSPEALKDGAPLVHDQAAGNLCYDWHLGDKAATDAAFAKAAPRHQAGPDQQPAGPQRDGAACRDRRVRPRHRRLHAVDDQPEPPRHPPADGRLRARHPRTQAPRHRPGCRRRLRLQDLPLRRGSHRHLGVERRSAARSSGWRNGRRASYPTPMAATTSPTPNWRWMPTASSWRCGSRRSPTWAPICPPSRRRSRPTSTPRCWPGSTRPRRSTPRSRRSSPTPSRSTPIAAPGGRKPAT